MASPTLRARARRSLGYRGLGRTLRVGGALALYRWRRGFDAPRPHAFDLEFGTETVEPVPGERVAGALEGTPYEPIDPVDFARVMSGLDLDQEQLADFDFIDFGCGRGRALMLAAAYPFARVTGIEYDRGLYGSAERNLEIFGRRGRRRQRSGPVTAVWADAARWELPERPSVYYMCEPFREPMMRIMRERIRASLGAVPRRAYVLYVGERCRRVWEEAEDFELMAAHDFDRVYRHRGGC